MKRIQAKHPRAIRWFHWVNFPLLSLMIWSGLLIYWANDVYGLKLGDHALIHFFPNSFYDSLGLKARLAEGMAWHFFLQWFFILNGISYVAYTVISGEWRYLVPNRHSFGEALDVFLHDLHLRRGALPDRKFNGAQQIAYTAVVIMGAGSVLTGLVMFKPVQLHRLTWLVGGYETARFIHFWLTLGYLFFFVIHLAQVVRAGWNNFRAMVTGYEIK